MEYKSIFKENLNPKEEKVLKRLLNTKSLWDVLESLKNLAYEKSEEIKKRFPEEKELIKSWIKDGNKIDKFLDKIEN